MVNDSLLDIMYALLSMRSALCGAVTPSLRAVTVDLDKERDLDIYRFFYDGPIDDHSFDLAGCATTEASNSLLCDVDYVRLDFPAPIPMRGSLAFLRKEPGIPPPTIQLLARPPKTIAVAYLSYTTQQGLLGRVVPSLREVSVAVDEEQKQLYFLFCYDEEITEELLTLSREVIAIAKQPFSVTFSIKENIIFVPFPKPVPSPPQGGIGVFVRSEGKW